MKKLSIILSTTAVLMGATAAMAAPCDTGSTNSTGKVDPAAKNNAGGNQPPSPGTIGAMNNAVPDQGLGQKAGTDKNKEDPAAKNTAGGDQPASPGTIGAMNNAGAQQNTSKNDGC